MLKPGDQSSNVITLKEWEEIVGIVEDIKVNNCDVLVYLYVSAWGKKVMLHLKVSEIGSLPQDNEYEGYSIGIIRTDLARPYYFRKIEKTRIPSCE